MLLSLWTWSLSCIPFLTIHNLRLFDAASLHGIERATKHRYGQGHFLVARNGGIDCQATGLALHVNDGATVAFGTHPQATKGDQTGSTRLAAALQIHAANSSLWIEDNGL